MNLQAVVLFMFFFTDPNAASTTLAAGDSAFVSQRYEDATSRYQEVLAQSPGSAAVLWRMARVKVAQGELLKDDKAEAVYREAADLARQSITADSTTSEGHTWLATALGEIAMYEGSKRKIQLCTEIKAELDKALALNPRDDVAWSIRGSFYRALGNVSWIEKRLASIFLGSLPDGGYEEAEVSLQSAIRIAPDVFRHRRELGLLYIDWGKRPEARQALEESLATPNLLASDVEAKSRVRRLLSTLD